MGIIRDINALVNPVKQVWLVVKAELDDMGINVKVVETHRTSQTQRAYYAQGRKPLAEVNMIRNAAGLWTIADKQNRKVTWTLESMHFFDIALDFALVDTNGKLSWDTKADINHDDISDYHNVGEVAKQYGFEWGGDFKDRNGKPIPDFAHLQYTGGLSIEDLRAGKRPEQDVLKYI